MNAAQLVRRDPALAALMGAIDGSNFGFASESDSEFGTDFEAEFGNGIDTEGNYFGYEFGAEPSTNGVPRPTPEQAIQLWNQTKQNEVREMQRRRLLEPNAGLKTKIEQYLFQLNQNVTLGVATAINLNNNPDTTFRPQRMLMNAPVPGFASITNVSVANINVTIGGGQAFDAFFVSALGVGVRMDMPTVTPANRATITGTTTVLVPVGYVGGAVFPFSTAFIGPSRMAG